MEKSLFSDKPGLFIFRGAKRRGKWGLVQFRGGVVARKGRRETKLIHRYIYLREPLLYC